MVRRGGERGGGECSRQRRSEDLHLTQTEFCFSTTHEGRAIPNVAACGPSGLPYLIQFSRDTSSVSLMGGYHGNNIPPEVDSRLVGLSNLHEHILVATLFVRMIYLAESAILFLNLIHTSAGVQFQNGERIIFLITHFCRHHLTGGRGLT